MNSYENKDWIGNHIYTYISQPSFPGSYLFERNTVWTAVDEKTYDHFFPHLQCLCFSFAIQGAAFRKVMLFIYFLGNFVITAALLLLITVDEATLKEWGIIFWEN